MTDTTAVKPRLVGLDRLRGLAIALMVLDHVLVWLLAVAEVDGLAGGAIELARLSVTRLSLPLFGVLAGCGLVFSVRHRNFGVSIPWRHAAGALLILFLPTWWIGLGRPDVLVQFVFIIGFGGWAIRRWPVVLGAFGVVQAITWPIGGTGYQPGVVVALLALGVLGSAGGRYLSAEVAGLRLPGWLGTFGRYPVECYVGHVLVLLFLAVAW